jgi:hypothetical protein
VPALLKIPRHGHAEQSDLALCMCWHLAEDGHAAGVRVPALQRAPKLGENHIASRQHLHLHGIMRRRHEDFFFEASWINWLCGVEC